MWNVENTHLNPTLVKHCVHLPHKLMDNFHQLMTIFNIAFQLYNLIARFDKKCTILTDSFMEELEKQWNLIQWEIKLLIN